MAAAVMRAMTFGATSSREGRPGRSAGRDGDHSSRNSSRNRILRSLSTREQDADRERERAGEEPRSSLSLSRNSSRLTPPNPPGSVPGPTGILLNANRPASESPGPFLSPTSSPPSGNGVYHAPSSASSSLTSNLDLERTVSAVSFDGISAPPSTVTRPSHPTRSHSSSSILQSSSLASNQDQSRSSSMSCGEPSSSSSPGGGGPGDAIACSGMMSADSSATGSVSAAAAARKIRFAPLPQIRPRAYSTGRNLWFVGTDFEGEAAEGEEGTRRRLVRREDADEQALEDEYDDDYDEIVEGPLQKRGSWGDISAWVAGSKKDKDDDAVSVASSAGGAGGAETPTPSSKDAYSKILKPWRFGKSKKSKSAFPRKDSDEGTGLGGGVALSRQSSVDSDVSRRSSVDVGALASPRSRPTVSTGVPMRRASTWDSSESPSSSTSRPTSCASASPIARSSSSYGQPRQQPQSQQIYYASPARSGARRANYPPVAQRSRSARTPQKPPTKVDEPAFHEWGSSGSVGSVGSATSKSGGEEDDGSGMAWIRRRRAQREREEKEKEKREREARGGDTDAAALAPARDDSTTSSELMSRIGAPEPLAAPEDDDDGGDEICRERKFPARTSTLDSTLSSASTVMPTPPSPSVPGSSTPTRSLSGLSMTRPSLSGTTVASSAGSTATVGTATSTAKWEGEEKAGEGGVVMIEEPKEEDDDEEEEEDDDEGGEEEDDEGEEEDDDEGEKPDDESDLDEDELAQEEALVQAARKTAQGAGHERYHSASHRNKLTVVEHVKQHQPTRRASTSSNSAGVGVKVA
ncbi:hypothetical protein JCM1841_000044 [Sporobolomyces salmonicolor]